MKEFSRKLAAWYKLNKRELPWRQTKDPYKIWLSEVILQQTRVAQGLAYYLKFVERFPTVKHLALANEDEVLKLWQGLGYYSRARNLHAAAKQIISENKRGIFPAGYNEIIKMKGVGTYTASAISSICFNEAKAVVDGNVYRVLSRVFGIRTPIDSVKGKKEFQVLADTLLDKKNPGDHNQAVMEFGAVHCTPANPRCDACPFSNSCLANEKKIASQLPVKEKKTKVRVRYFYYLVFDYKGQTFLRKRKNQKDIWQNLYEFPLIEAERSQPDKKIVNAAVKEYGLQKNKLVVGKISSYHKHILSHQVLQTKFINVEMKSLPAKFKREHIAAKKNDVNTFALPRLIEKFVEKELDSV